MWTEFVRHTHSKQILNIYLLPGSKLLSPLLYLLAVLLVQLFQLLGLMFNQEVAFLILKKKKTCSRRGKLLFAEATTPIIFNEPLL